MRLDYYRFIVALVGPWLERRGWLSKPMRLQLTSLLTSPDRLTGSSADTVLTSPDRLTGSSADTVLTCDEVDRSGIVLACSRLVG